MSFSDSLRRLMGLPSRPQNEPPPVQNPAFQAPTLDNQMAASGSSPTPPPPPPPAPENPAPAAPAAPAETKPF